MNNIKFLVDLKVREWGPIDDVSDPSKMNGSLVYNVPQVAFQVLGGSGSIQVLDGCAFSTINNVEELSEIVVSYARDGQFRGKSWYRNTAFLLEREERNKQYLDRIEQKIKDLRRDFSTNLKKRDEINLQIERASKIRLLVKDQVFQDGNLLLEFKDIVASDIHHNGEDINLGNLSVQVSMNTDNFYVTIVEGDYPNNNNYNSEAYHPHQLSEGLCLGTFEPDIMEAINNLDFNMVRALVNEYLTTYNSEDSAGQSWIQWTDKEGYFYCEESDRWYPDEEGLRSEYHDNTFHEDVVEYSDYMNDYILRDYATGSELGIIHEDISKPDFFGNIYPEDELVEINGDYFYREEVVTTEDGIEAHESFVEDDIHGNTYLIEDLVEINGDMYYKESDEVIFLDGEYHLSENVVEIEGVEYLKEDTVEIDGELYPIDSEDIEEVDGVYVLKTEEDGTKGDN